MNIPDNDVGVVAFGVKTGIITLDDNIVDVVRRSMEKNPDLIHDNDIVCVTEAVVAITQQNIVHLDDVTNEIRTKLKLKDDSTIGVIYPILSRNRFSMMLKAIAKAVPKGKVIVQLMFPADEQGNPIIAKATLKGIDKSMDDLITVEEIQNNRLLHPETGLDYIKFYEEIVKENALEVEVFLANSVEYMVNKQPDAIIVSNVHARVEVLAEVKKAAFENAITLQDICSNPQNIAYSEFGLLGSNILDPANEQLKLCPKNPDAVCEDIQKIAENEFNKHIEVVIYGDGAYKDPESGIYELADPVSCFGCTKGIKNKNRIGVKTKYLMQKLYNEGKTKEEIAAIIEEEKRKFIEKQDKEGFSAQGTTPRKIENLVASLADLISGSGDANTPIIVVRGFI
jgi:F420-0:gamma-glutamyl ligase